MQTSIAADVTEKQTVHIALFKYCEGFLCTYFWTT